MNVAGLYHAWGVCLNPDDRSRTGSARCVPLDGLILGLSNGTLAVNRKPLSAVVIPLACHPARMVFPIPLMRLPKYLQLPTGSS